MAAILAVTGGHGRPVSGHNAQVPGAAATSSSIAGTATGSRPRLAVALTFPVFPALGGGQVRALNLCRQLACVFDVEIVSLAAVGEGGERRALGRGVFETQVPKSLDHAAAESELERDAGTAVTDIAMSDLFALTPGYLSALSRAADGARAVIACHPYPLPAIRAVTDAPVWYEAQDVEAELKRHVLGDSPVARRLLVRAEEVERECCETAEQIWACSEEDRARLIERYGVPAGRILVVPNGVALEDAEYVAPLPRRERRRRLGWDDAVHGVFVASWHEPNVVAALEILQMAAQTPSVGFLVIGSVGMALATDPRPANVQITGPVSLAFKQDLLGVADVALNPVRTGSGSNLKMLDYFAAGIPVLSTPFGARGLGVTAGAHYVEAEPWAMTKVLEQWPAEAMDARAARVEAARRHVEEHMSWDAIGSRLRAQLVSTSS
jgi:glycosyltransferase involved in cell wall biosynthesis